MRASGATWGPSVETSSARNHVPLKGQHLPEIDYIYEVTSMLTQPRTVITQRYANHYGRVKLS